MAAKPKKKITSSKKKNPPTILKDPIAEYKAIIKAESLGEIHELSDDQIFSRVSRFVSTQSVALDKLLTVPGIPCGRVTEVFGEPGVGKTTLMGHLLAQVQREEGVGVLVDTEQAVDMNYLTKLGVDPDKLLIAEPESMSIEGVFRIIEKTLDFWDQYPDKLLFIGWDSIAATPALAELNGDIADAHPAVAARLLRAGIRRVNMRIAKREAAVVLINQQYSKIGPFPGKKTYGGEGIPYWSSLRLKLEKADQIKKSDGQIIGHEMRCTVVKNKLSGTLNKGIIGVINGIGFDNVWVIHQELLKTKFITQGGAWQSLRFTEEEEPLKWMGGYQGLLGHALGNPELFKKLIDFYRTLPL